MVTQGFVGVGLPLLFIVLSSHWGLPGWLIFILDTVALAFAIFILGWHPLEPEAKDPQGKGPGNSIPPPEDGTVQ